MKAIGVGLVGAGNAAKFHLESLLQVHGVQVQLTGVTSLRPESRRAFGKRHGIPAFDDIASMLPHVDVLDIVSPPAAHDGRAFGRGILVDTHRVRRYHRLGVSAFQIAYPPNLEVPPWESSVRKRPSARIG